MSMWGSMYDRGGGDTIRSEEFIKVYHGHDGDHHPVDDLAKGEYKGYHYVITTTGSYPVVEISTKSEISIFSGYELVVLKIDDKSHELERNFVNGNETKFRYEFNKEGDYLHNVWPRKEGHKYTVQELEEYVRKFIDEIIECENEKYKNLD